MYQSGKGLRMLTLSLIGLKVKLLLLHFVNRGHSDLSGVGAMDGWYSGEIHKHLLLMLCLVFQYQWFNFSNLRKCNLFHFVDVKKLHSPSFWFSLHWFLHLVLMFLGLWHFRDNPEFRENYPSKSWKLIMFLGLWHFRDNPEFRENYPSKSWKLIQVSWQNKMEGTNCFWRNWHQTETVFPLFLDSGSLVLLQAGWLVGLLVA